MRCRYCGSASLHADKQHKTFSSGKAVAGAVVFGPVGAAAGLMGKERSGYRCGACGAFMEAPMDLSTEHSIDRAIDDAESGRDIAMFQYFKKQYPNIQAVIPQKSAARQEQIAIPSTPAQEKDERDPSLVKHEYRNLKWNKDCPVYVERVIIHATPSGDTLSLLAWNQGKDVIRSVYFQVVVYDDTGDEVGKSQCVYQGNSVAPGGSLPIEKEFALGTDLAYRVSLRCEKVSLENDTVWRAANAGEEITVPVQPELREMGFPRLKYVLRDLHTVSKADEESSLYLPIEGEDFWQCICGQPVALHHPCPRCGATLEKLNELLSQERLQKMQQSCVKKIAADRAAATMELYRQALQHEMDKKYQKALTLQKQDSEGSLAQAAEIFEGIPEYKDSAQRAAACRERIPALREELREKEAARIRKETARIREEREKQATEEAKKKRARKIAVVFVFVVLVAVILTVLMRNVIIPNVKYSHAVALMEAGDYEGAIAAFEKLGDYKDAQVRSFELWGDITSREVLSAGNDHTVGLCADGTVVAVGKNADGRCNVSDWSNIVAISAGGWHTVGLRADGTVVAVGENADGRCNVSGWSNIVAISAGSRHTVCLRAGGTVAAVGRNSSGQCDVSGWSNVVAISAGGSHTVGLRADGTVAAVGNNKYGQCDVSDWSDVVAIAAGYSHTVGLRADGTVVAVGYNSSGQCNVSDWSNIVAISAGSSHTVGLCADGTVVAVGENDDGQCNVSDWSNIVAISAGYSHTVGLRADGTVAAMGYNKHGQYDVSDWGSIMLPDQ